MREPWRDRYRIEREQRERARRAPAPPPVRLFCIRGYALFFLGSVFGDTRLDFPWDLPWVWFLRCEYISRFVLMSSFRPMNRCTPIRFFSSGNSKKAACAFCVLVSGFCSDWSRLVMSVKLRLSTSGAGNSRHGSARVVACDEALPAPGGPSRSPRALAAPPTL